MLEKELIQECISGNRVAQKELYERYSPSLFAICMRYMSTREEAEDVLIMGFTTIFAKLDTFNGGGSFEGWMKHIIVNTAVSECRANRLRYELEDKSEELSQKQKKGLASEEITYSKINTKYIMKQIQQLSIGYRTIFNLYAIEGYSYNDIAIKMEIEIGTVRSQLAKARKLLQQKLKDFKYDE